VSKARILVIDDQLYFRSFMEGMLEEEGYTVQTADGGLHGLELLEQEGPFDVVLSDLVMPGMDGLETVRRIRDRLPEQQVVVVTGVGDVRSAVDALRVGAAEYLLKPVERDDLVHTVESLLEQQRLRVEHERLISENLAFLGFLSTIDRGLGLIGRAHRRGIAEGLLELLCQEAKARGGVVWGREPAADGTRFVCLATQGDGTDDGTLPELSPERWDALHAARVELEVAPGDRRGGVLWVASARGDTAWAVARLAGLAEGTVSEEIRSSCAKLGEIAAIAFENADRTAGREGDTLRDPGTGLHSLAFLRDAVAREIHRGRRYGRPFALLQLEVGEPDAPDLDAETSQQIGAAVAGTLRPAEVVASDGTRRFWVLAAEADPLGCVVVKGRLTEAIRAVAGGEPVAVGAANFPTDGESFEALAATVQKRIEEDRSSLLRSLALPETAGLDELAQRLRYQAELMDESFVAEAVELIIDEVRSRPDLRGLIFISPGTERAAVFLQLAGFGRRSLSTEILVATDGDTVPVSSTVKAIALPRSLPSDTTWVVRFGEAPPYVLIAGPPGARQGGRPVFHTHDRSLVEFVVSRLRAEVGFGVGTRR
jgi:CheY-like chemotaxis protein